MNKITNFFPKIFLNLSQFWLNFGKIDPFIYQILHLTRGHSYTKRLILLPMLAAHLCRVFCTKYPPPPPRIQVDLSRLFMLCVSFHTPYLGFKIFDNNRTRGFTLHMTGYAPACTKRVVFRHTTPSTSSAYRVYFFAANHILGVLKWVELFAVLGCKQDWKTALWNFMRNCQKNIPYMSFVFIWNSKETEVWHIISSFSV